MLNYNKQWEYNRIITDLFKFGKYKFATEIDQVRINNKGINDNFNASARMRAFVVKRNLFLCRL